LLYVKNKLQELFLHIYVVKPETKSYVAAQSRRSLSIRCEDHVGTNIYKQEISGKLTILAVNT
jgi:hypothetical protein